jgi:hypothetical protein
MIRLPRSTAVLRTRRAIEGAVRGFLVVQNGANPTSDYYLVPRLPAALTRYAELGSAGKGLEPRPGELVIFCRYVNSGWLDWLERHRAVVAGAALFIDDDYDMMVRSSRAPLSYRRRIWSWHHRHLPRLARRVDEVWVSTEVLRARYGGSATLLPPVPPAPEPAAADRGEAPVVAYHATRIHRPELSWLVPILSRVLRRVPHARCHITGFRPRDRALRALPRTRLSPQLPWPDYRRAARETGADVALAPLLPGLRNEARSHAKAFDITRLGAAGLYEQGSIYGALVEHGVDGLLLPSDPDAWETALVELLQDAPRRRALAASMARTLTHRRAALIGDTRLLDRLLVAPAAALLPEDAPARGDVRDAALAALVTA